MGERLRRGLRRAAKGLDRAAEGLRTTAAGEPSLTLGVLAAVAVLGTALAARDVDRLSLSAAGAPRGDLIVEVREPAPAGSGAYRVAVQTMRLQLSADPAVASVRERPVRGHPRETALEVGLKPEGHEQEEALERFERNLDPGRLRISFAGEVATLRKARDDAVDDLALLLLAVPLVALVLVGVLGARRAGAAALAAAATAAGAALACELLGGLIDISVLALAGALAAGTLTSLQLTVAGAAGAGGRTLGLGAIASAAVFAALGLLGVGYLAAIGLGGAMGSLLALPASLAAVGACAALEAGGEATSTRRPLAGSRAWSRFADLVSWSRLAAAAIGLLAVALLLVCAVPATRLRAGALFGEVAAIGAPQLAAAVAAAVLVTALLGWAASRRPVLSAGSALAAALPAAGATGLLVLSFQDGRLEGLLDYSSAGSLHLGSTAAALAVVAAVAAMQAVSLVAAARPGRWRTDPAVVMARCGPVATVTCLSGAAAGAALAASSLPFVKEFGVALAAGLMLQVLVVQTLLGPGLLAVLSRRSRGQ
ncbi:MAG: hypothetical protein AABM29_06080 [Actinomycetota bacterium]